MRLLVTPETRAASTYSSRLTPTVWFRTMR
jgi:hypothetical protein